MYFQESCGFLLWGTLVENGSSSCKLNPSSPRVRTRFSQDRNRIDQSVALKTCPGVPESLWKPHKSKGLTFLHRSYVPLFFSTPKKYFSGDIDFSLKFPIFPDFLKIFRKIFFRSPKKYFFGVEKKSWAQLRCRKVRSFDL